MALKIVLVDDQPVPGLTLRRWLRKQRDLEVVGEAVPGSPVLALIQLTEPDAVVLDVHTSPEAGLNVARMIREQYPNVPIVAIGEATAGNLRVEAAEAGAWAFFPKTRPEDLARAIPSVIAGKGKTFVDLAGRSYDRPQSESFVALPDEKSQRKAPPPPVVPALAPAAPTSQPVAAHRLQPVAAPKASPAPTPKPPSPAAPKAPPVATPKAAPATRKMAPVVAARTPARTVKPPTPSERPRREATSVGNGHPGITFELPPPPPARIPRDAVAWTHSALEPVSESPPQKKPRRRRGKKEEVPSEIDVRGPTGLPRRFGGHR